MLVCRTEVECIGGGSALPLLRGRSGEDVCEEGADVVVKLRVEICSERVSVYEYAEILDCGLQLALLVLKHLIEGLLIVVDSPAHFVDPAIIFVLETINYQQHLLTFEAALIFFLLGSALVVQVFRIRSALG
jgi:hypothetical protein